LSIRKIDPPQKVNTPVEGRLWSIHCIAGVNEPTVFLVATQGGFLGLGGINYYAVGIPLGAEVAPVHHFITVSGPKHLSMLTSLRVRFDNREWEVWLHFTEPGQMTRIWVRPPATK